MPAKRPVKRGKRYYGNVPVGVVAQYAAILLRQINNQFAQVMSFTRDDLVRVTPDQFESVGFASRYRTICLAVQYLVQHGELVQKKFPDLCLPDRAESYRFTDTSISAEYAPTIRRLVTKMPSKEAFTVIQVVTNWRTDPQLTLDSKRKAVRGTMSRLVREGVCTQLNKFEYEVG
jgi:hypothetical protein